MLAKREIIERIHNIRYGNHGDATAFILGTLLDDIAAPQTDNLPDSVPGVPLEPFNRDDIVGYIRDSDVESEEDYKVIADVLQTVGVEMEDLVAILWEEYL
jgi:hypothetical protein